jgi:hypothetical protein
MYTALQQLSRRSFCAVPSDLTDVQVSEACQDLLRRMMTSDPKNRISVQARQTAMHGQHMAVGRQTPCSLALLHAADMPMVFQLQECLLLQGIMQHPWFLHDLPPGTLDVNTQLQSTDTERCAPAQCAVRPAVPRASAHSKSYLYSARGLELEVSYHDASCISVRGSTRVCCHV